MVLTINKWGNSQGIRLPRNILEEMHLEIGSKLNAEYQDGKLIIEPTQKPVKYDIHNLIDSISDEYKPEEVDWGKPEGCEIW